MKFNRTAAVMKLVREYTDRGTLYISGPNADCNTTELVEYNVLYTRLSEEQKEEICYRAQREIPGVQLARLTRHKDRNIKICFGERANGQPAVRSAYAQGRRRAR